MLRAVGNGRRTAREITDLLDKYEDNFDIIQTVITEEIVMDPAGSPVATATGLPGQE